MKKSTYQKVFVLTSIKIQSHAVHMTHDVSDSSEIQREIYLFHQLKILIGDIHLLEFSTILQTNKNKPDREIANFLTPKSLTWQAIMCP